MISLFDIELYPKSLLDRYIYYDKDNIGEHRYLVALQFEIDGKLEPCPLDKLHGYLVMSTEDLHEAVVSWSNDSFIFYEDEDERIGDDFHRLILVYMCYSAEHSNFNYPKSYHTYVKQLPTVVLLNSFEFLTNVNYLAMFIGEYCIREWDRIREADMRDFNASDDAREIIDFICASIALEHGIRRTSEIFGTVMDIGLLPEEYDSLIVRFHEDYPAFTKWLEPIIKYVFENYLENYSCKEIFADLRDIKEIPELMEIIRKVIYQICPQFKAVRESLLQVRGLER